MKVDVNIRILRSFLNFINSRDAVKELIVRLIVRDKSLIIDFENKYGHAEYIIGKVLED